MLHHPFTAIPIWTCCLALLVTTIPISHDAHAGHTISVDQNVDPAHENAALDQEVQAADGQPAIALQAAKGSQAAKVVVSGIKAELLGKLQALPTAGLGQHLQLFVKAAHEKGEAPAVLGDVLVKEKNLVFEPRYPLEAGVEYLARFREDSQAAWQTQVLVLPKKKVEITTQVTAVYPTAGQLPQNLLKFYVYFSAPMTQGEAYEHIELLGADGKPVPFPFLEIAEELWDKSGQRLTTHGSQLGQ